MIYFIINLRSNIKFNHLFMRSCLQMAFPGMDHMQPRKLWETTEHRFNRSTPGAATSTLPTLLTTFWERVPFLQTSHRLLPLCHTLTTQLLFWCGLINHNLSHSNCRPILEETRMNKWPTCAPRSWALDLQFGQSFSDGVKAKLEPNQIHLQLLLDEQSGAKHFTWALV